MRPLFGLSLFLALPGVVQAKGPPPHAAAGQGGAMVADEPVQIGAPYQVGSKTYTPEDTAGYDDVGHARIYTPDTADETTANGERFIADGITAAHRTLPLPSYVEVTSLDTGRTILVRINDRGPMTGEGIIALSPGAAEQLGMAGDAFAPVRIRRVNPPEQERAVLRAHGRAAERMDTPASLLVVLRQRLAPPALAVAPVANKIAPRGKPRPGATFTPPPVRSSPPVAAPKPAQAASDPFVVEGEGASPPSPSHAPAPARISPPAAPRTSTGSYVVQVAAFSTQARAEALARKVGGSTTQAGKIWRVRLGPFATQAAAQQAVRSVAAKGLENARIMANDTP